MLVSRVKMKDCDKGISGILQACPRNITELLNLEKEKRFQPKRKEQARSAGEDSVIKEEVETGEVGQGTY